LLPVRTRMIARTVGHSNPTALHRIKYFRATLSAHREPITFLIIGLANFASVGSHHKTDQRWGASECDAIPDTLATCSVGRVPISPGSPLRTRGEVMPQLRTTISARGSVAQLVVLGSSSIQYRNPIIVLCRCSRRRQPIVLHSIGTLTPISANGFHRSFLPNHPASKCRRVASSMARRIPPFQTRSFP